MLVHVALVGLLAEADGETDVTFEGFLPVVNLRGLRHRRFVAPPDSPPVSRVGPPLVDEHFVPASKGHATDGTGMAFLQ